MFDKRNHFIEPSLPLSLPGAEIYTEEDAESSNQNPEEASQLLFRVTYDLDCRERAQRRRVLRQAHVGVDELLQ